MNVAATYRRELFARVSCTSIGVDTFYHSLRQVTQTVVPQTAAAILGISKIST